MADYYFSFSKMLRGLPGSRKYLGMELYLPFKNRFSKLLTGKAFNSESTHISIQSLKRAAPGRLKRTEVLSAGTLVIGVRSVGERVL